MNFHYLFFILLFINPLLLFPQATDTLVAMDSIEIVRPKTRISNIEHFSLTHNEIKMTPKFLGQADPIKAIKFLPGFGNGGDGNAGVYFRGLGSGNNGYYFNGIQIQNPNHFLGLFSTFNIEMVDDISVYNAISPGIYTGKISTYIDINSNWKVGDTVSYNADLSLLHAGGGVRIEQENRLLDIQVRKTFMNQTLWPYAGKILKNTDQVQYDLYDVNINAQRLFDRQYLRFIFYKGQDHANLGLHDNVVSNNVKWGNTVLGLEHHYEISNNIGLTSRVNNSNYKTTVDMDFVGDVFSFSNNQNNSVFSTIFDHKAHPIFRQAGVVITHYGLNPRNNRSDMAFSSYSFSSSSLIHTKLFGSFERNLFDNIKGTLQTSYNIIGSDHFIDYQALIDYHIDTKTKVYASNSLLYQPIHHIPLTNISVPIEFLVASNHEIRPSKMKQGLIGTRYSDSKLEFSVDAYYRDIQKTYEFNGNIIDLNSGIGLTELMNEGRGISYGIDIFSVIRRPKHFLMLNYSYARSFRKTNNSNHGNWHPFIYDRPHNGSIAFQYMFSKKLDVSASFVLSSGSTYTPGVGRYYFNNNIVGEYGVQNSMRTKIYHRLDLNITYKIADNKSNRQELGIGITNIYNRKNPLYQYLSYDKQHLDTYGSFLMHQRTVGIIPILPSITYSIRL